MIKQTEVGQNLTLVSSKLSPFDIDLELSIVQSILQNIVKKEAPILSETADRLIERLEKAKEAINAKS